MKTLVTMRVQCTIEADDEITHDVFVNDLRGRLEKEGVSVDIEDETPLDEEE